MSLFFAEAIILEIKNLYILASSFELPDHKFTFSKKVARDDVFKYFIWLMSLISSGAMLGLKPEFLIKSLVLRICNAI